MTKPIEYRDENGNLIASTEPRSDVGLSVEERMRELMREGKLIDPELLDAIHFAVAECSREVRHCGTLPFGDEGILDYAERLYSALQRGAEVDRGKSYQWDGEKFADVTPALPPLPEQVRAILFEKRAQ